MPPNTKETRLMVCVLLWFLLIGFLAIWAGPTIDGAPTSGDVTPTPITNQRMIQVLEAKERYDLQFFSVVEYCYQNCPDADPSAVFAMGVLLPRWTVNRATGRVAADPKRFIKTMIRESRLQPRAKNPTSTAYGICQFLSSSFHTSRGVSRATMTRGDWFSAEYQIYEGLRLADDVGWQQWVADAHPQGSVRWLDTDGADG